jgi:HK97 family phage prohead protease
MKMKTKRTINGERELRCQLSEVRIQEREGAGGSGGRTVTGYAAKFNKWSEPICGWFTEQIRTGAFDGCDTGDAIMCFNHNVDDILARTASGSLSLSVDEIGLRFSFEAPNTSIGNDMVELLRRGDIDKCSLRFVVEADEWLYADEKNGLKYDQRTILNIAKLYDVALVVYPAYPDTEASVRHLEERKAEYLRSHKQPYETGAEGETPEDVASQGSRPDITGATTSDHDTPEDRGRHPPTDKITDINTDKITDKDTCPATEQPTEQVTEQPADNGSASRRRTIEYLQRKPITK